jgi:hypothetical protein
LFQIKLSAEIVRGRSCASVLVIPRRKKGLCEALPGRRPWPELELPWDPMGSSPEREGRGKGKRERAAQLGCSWGHHEEGEGYRRGVHHGTPPSCSSVRCCCLHVVLFVRKKRRSKERRKRKGRKR